MKSKFHKALIFTVSNFSQKGSTVISPPFSSGGCEWFIKGTRCDNYLSLFLYPNEPKSLGLNWTKRASFYFVLLNESGQETYRTPESGDQLFCAESLSLGFPKAFSLKELLENRVLVNDRFITEIHMKVVEVVDDNPMLPASLFTNKLLRCEKETVDVNGFQVLSSQATSARQIFMEHPNIALGFKSKNQVVKTEYMNVLLNLLETVKKPLESISETDLSNAHSELHELTEVGFKLEWLKTKLEEVSLEYKKVNAEGFQIQQLEEQVKNLELIVLSLKVELDKEKMKSSSDAAKVLSLEQMLANEKAKSEIATANFVSLKEAFSDLKVELEKEKSKSSSVLSLKEILSDLIVELEKEKIKSSNATAQVLSLEETLSDLIVELEKEKIKSSNATAQVLSLEETLSDLKVENDQTKVLSGEDDDWEDDDLFKPTNCLGIQQRNYGYKQLN